MDPFVTLRAAAVVAKTIKLGTGVCLVIQRDPIQTAKLVASLDQLSGGRFLFGVGDGWNQDEMENHGTNFETRHKKVREQIEAMKAIWTKSKPEYHGEFVNFDRHDDLAEAGAEAAPADPGRRHFPYGARRALRYGDGWIPLRARAAYPEVRSFCRSFAKWRRRPTAIPRRCRLASGTRRKTPIS